jgi:hypothetical protein
MLEFTEQDMAEAFVIARNMAARAAVGDRAGIVELLRVSRHSTLVVFALADLLARMISIAAPGEDPQLVLMRAGKKAGGSSLN